MIETDKSDVNPFEKLMDKHAPNIELLAIQYGCSADQAGRVTEDTFRTVHSSFNYEVDEEQFLIHLYQIAIEKLAQIQLAESKHTISAFEEDQQLQEKILSLKPKEKSAFILSQFHGMSATNISTLLGLSENEIMQAISEAFKQLQARQPKLEKRLEFLRKSYDRIVFLFNKENVFNVPVEEEIETNREQKQKLPKKVMLSWMAGVITLIAIIAFSIVTGEEYQQSAAEKYVERLDALFESEVEKKFSELGLTEEIIFDGTPYSFPFATNAREAFKVMMSQVRGQLNRNQKMNKKEIERQYDEVISKLELPSEMLDRLFKNPLTNDKEKSEAFITEYIEKFFNLKESYDFMFVGHERILEDALIDGEIDIKSFLAARDSYPDNIKNALDGMLSQNYYPISIPNWAPFYPKHVNNEISNQLRESLHKDVEGYVNYLESEPFINYPDLVYPIEESIDFMNEMEKTLLKVDTHTLASAVLMDTYTSILYELIIGTDTNQIFDQTGKVKEEYRKGWTRIASLGETFPSAFIMQQVVSEMEESDWKVSEAYRNLEHGTFYHAVDHAKLGILSSYSLKESEQQGRITVSPEDPDYQASVHEVYDKFSKAHELHYLQNANPLVVIGVYYLANELEDPATMWHLLNHEYSEETLESYMENWKKVEPLPANVETLSVETNGGSLNGVPQVPIGYTIGDETTYFAWLVAEGEYHDTWRILDILTDG